MKTISLICLLILSACTSKTEWGDCVGLNDDEDPSLNYRYSAWNIAMGVIFVEMIFPPIVVALNELRCPVGPKAEEAGK